MHSCPTGRDVERTSALDDRRQYVTDDARGSTSGVSPAKAGLVPGLQRHGDRRGGVPLQGAVGLRLGGREAVYRGGDPGDGRVGAHHWTTACIALFCIMADTP